MHWCGIAVVLQVVKEMNRAKVQPNEYTYDVFHKGAQWTKALILCGNGATGRWEDMLDVFSEAQAAGVVPDVDLYNALLAGLKRRRQWDRAVQVFSEMQQAGVQASVVTYNLLINVYAKANHWDWAVEVFDYMQQAGARVEGLGLEGMVLGKSFRMGARAGNLLLNGLARRRTGMLPRHWG